MKKNTIIAAVGAVLLLVVLFAVVIFPRAQRSARRSICIKNLRMINSAKHSWSLKEGALLTDRPTLDDLADYVIATNELYCLEAPKSQWGNFSYSYSIGAVDTPAICKVARIEGHELAYNGPRWTFKEE